jgi:hypothetical protein
MFKDSKGNTLQVRDAVVFSGGEDVWYVERVSNLGGPETILLARRGVYLQVSPKDITKTDCPNVCDLIIKVDTTQITPPVDLGADMKEDKDLLEKLKRVYQEWAASCGKVETLYITSDLGELTADLVSTRNHLTICLPIAPKLLVRNKLKVSNCGDCTLEYVHDVIQKSYKDIDKGTDDVVDFMKYLVESLEERIAEKREMSFKKFTDKFKL